jgi:lantibiotic modifying enzyme
MAHGAAGIGWALARLAPVAPHVAGLADAAFAWQETLYHPDRPGWRDLRARDQVIFMEAWCHGAVGIGLVAADLLLRSGEPRWGDLLARAASVTSDSGPTGNYSLCHGDLGAWELLARADSAGLAPAGLDRDRLAADILTGLREHGPQTSVASHAVFQPGLVLGAGGVAYQLLRMHPECQLPSVLLPDPEAAA